MRYIHSTAAQHTFFPRFDDAGKFTTSHGVTYTRSDFIDSPQAVMSYMSSYAPRFDALSAFFNRAEVATLLNKVRGFSLSQDDWTTALLSYENPWGAAGGVLAVGREAPDAMVRAGLNTLRLSPYHSNLKNKLQLNPKDKVAECNVPIDNGAKIVPVSIYKVSDPRPPHGTWYLMEAPGYFDLDGGFNGTDPYFDRADSKPPKEQVDRRAVNNALFASAAVPYVMRALGHTKNIIFEAQDWQFAPVNLFGLTAQLRNGTEEPVLESAIVLNTLHNPYDKYLPRDILARYTSRVQGYPRPGVSETVLAQLLELSLAPASTVSGGFVRGLLESPVMLHHYAQHLTETLRRHGLIAITNGPLAPPSNPFSLEAVTAAQRGDNTLVQREKLEARADALKALHQYLLAQENTGSYIGSLQGGSSGFVGGDIFSLDPSVPLIAFYGRFDLGQKGIDVAVDAISKMPQGLARYVLISWPGSDEEYVGRHHEEYEKLARRRPGEFLFIKERAPFFKQLMKGASFVGYPSIYEPFGSKADAYREGTPTIARSVDGLIHQSMHLAQPQDSHDGSTPSFAAPYRPIVLYHEGVAPGIDLPRELVGLQQSTLPEDRFGNPVFGFMSDALKDAMVVACSMFSSENGRRYYRGLHSLTELPDWETNVNQRIAWYAGTILACRR
jgi:hypothetical protein